MDCEPKVVAGRYTVASRAVFELGTLRGEQASRLRSRCRQLGVRGYSRLNRDQLIAAILERTDES